MVSLLDHGVSSHMTPTEPTLVPVTVEPAFDSFAVRLAIAGFLAGYGDATRGAYGFDLRQWLGVVRRPRPEAVRGEPRQRCW